MTKTLRTVLIAIATASFVAHARTAMGAGDVNDIAESYVKLVLEVGLHDPYNVDAYFGPPEWKPSEDRQQAKLPAEPLRAKADALIERLGQVDPCAFADLDRQRYACLKGQLHAVRTKIDLLAGAKMSFDEESRALYGVVAPPFDDRRAAAALKELDDLLPGQGELYLRFYAYRAGFIIPQARLEEALRATLPVYRERTLEHLPLPPSEEIELEFSGDTPWGGCLIPKGDGGSLLRLHPRAVFTVADVVLLATHEAYPGHHAHLTLLQDHLLKGRKWVEYWTLPPYSPPSLVMEGLAEYGRKDLIASPSQDRTFAIASLFPLVGADAGEAERCFKIMTAVQEMRMVATVEAARQYLDGKMTRNQACVWLAKYALCTPGESSGIVEGVIRTRSHVISYTVGYDLVRRYIARHGGTEQNVTKRWELFEGLLTRPLTPAALAEQPELLRH